MARLLIIDDEPGVARALERFAEGEGHTAEVVATGEAGVAAVEAQVPDLVLCDVRLPGMDGLAVLGALRERAPDLPVIVMTAHGTVDTAVQAIQRGAYDYGTKPLDLDKLRVTVARALERRRLSREVAALRRELGGRPGRGLVGSSPAMQEVFKRIGAVAGSEASVLLTGESGTGKEMVARAIHAASTRAEGPFVPVNCGAVPETLLESELYGHEKGAFTGAEARKRGRIEVAHGGTLFLDEVGDLPAAAQVKLLRFLEERVIERVGGTEPIAVDTRLVAATNVDISERLRAGTFREDLYYRLNVVSIALPPLRDRLTDLPLLVAHFLEASGAGATAISEEAFAALRSYTWPGNVRELRNAVEHAVVLARGRTIGTEHLPPDVMRGGPGRTSGEAIGRLMCEELDRLRADGVAEPWEPLMDLVEEPLVRRALALTNNNQVQASALLGIHRTTLRKKMERFGLL